MRCFVALLLCLGSLTASAEDFTLDTKLLEACSAGNARDAKLLIELGASVEALDKLGRSMLDEAVASNNSEALCLLIEAGCLPTKRTSALRFWQMREARLAELLADDADPQASLFAAAQAGDYDLVRTLLDRGVDLHQRDGARRRA